ncbi:MAG: amidohydrolase family protein [Pseudomonadales bacterium]|nr:amidohydrolase family protein [Pseudomonadales bacterium]MCP5184980.1 amidohydrolase family protein [Pseudomonadales bacterium]
MTTTVIRGGTVLDPRDMSLRPNESLVIRDGRVEASASHHDADVVVDADGRYVMPGFIDAHVHFRLATLNFPRLSQWTEVQFGIAMARLAEATLARGFTTVRDLGGDIVGLRRAIASGMVRGPDTVHANLMISQTGGHGDVEGGVLAVPDCACQMRHSAFGIIADGPDAVRKAARHVLRAGADFLKIHVSGGVATPTDPLECTQYTAEEVRAAVQEAANRRTYVSAHAYTCEAIQMAVRNGVRCIEHGNLLDADTARLMAENQVFLVPTLVAYKGMAEMGRKLGFPERNLAKNEIVLAAGFDSLQLAQAAGVQLGWGTDLVGESQVMQREEFALRARVQSAGAILHAMYVVNPVILQRPDIGRLAPGMQGDAVITTVNPLENIAALANDDAVSTVIQRGVPLSP